MIRRTDFPYDGSAHNLIDRVARASVLLDVIILVRIRKDLISMVLKELYDLLFTFKNNEALSAQEAYLTEQAERLETEINELIAENARRRVDQEKYSARYNELTDKLTDTQQGLGSVKEQLHDNSFMAMRLEDFIDRLVALDGKQTEFDSEFFALTVDHLTVYRDKRVVVTFNGGYEVEVR